MRYGVPYQGSKNQIARWVIDNLPEDKILVDLFAGGCAVTHAAMLSGKGEDCRKRHRRRARAFLRCNRWEICRRKTLDKSRRFSKLERHGPLCFTVLEFW